MKLNISELEFRHSPFLEGRIFWEHDGRFFPGRDWFDNMNVLLGWWLTALLKIELDEPADFSFMEGSYQLVISLQPTGEVLFEDPESNDFSGLVSFRSLADQVFHAHETVRKLAEQRKYPIEMGDAEALLRIKELLESKSSRLEAGKRGD